MMHGIIRAVAAHSARQPAAAAAASIGKRAITQCVAGNRASVTCQRGLVSSSGSRRRRSSSTTSGGDGGIATEWEGERPSASGGDELQRSLSPDEVNCHARGRIFCVCCSGDAVTAVLL